MMVSLIEDDNHQGSHPPHHRNRHRNPVITVIYKDLEDARRDIGRFIDEIYNADRLHSALGCKTPLEFEAEQAQAPAIKS